MDRCISNDPGPFSDLGREVPGMTVVTPRSGFDLEYYLNRVHGERSPGGYYLNAAQQGEAEGRWFGKGAQALGLRDGQQVKREPYLAVYNIVDPRTGGSSRAGLRAGMPSSLRSCSGS